ncbi:MAG TPA: P-II family nitrogen regulator [Candidatus Manganitrophaceae bacterium]|nr:P-II family nitrogen regulator [Candidatus Manganitrophaceae bacterium]
MKMVQAIIRPEREREVIASLEKAGFYPFTRQGVFGRGRQRDIQVGPVRYEELAKVWLMIVVDEDEVDRLLDTLKIAARTGNPGDGKLFVSTLAEARSVRK